MSIQDGWMDGVERIPSAAAGGFVSVRDGEMWPKRVVSHVMQGYQRTMIDWANERPPLTWKAVHFTVGRDGRTVQHVPLWTPGRHVGDANLSTIGIEHEGFSVDPVVYGYDYLYDAEHPWPEPLVEATIKVHRWVFEAIRYYDQTVLPDEFAVTTHSVLDPVWRAQDPGSLWLATVRPLIFAALAPPESPPQDLEVLLREAKNAGFDAGRAYGWTAHAEAVDRQLAGLRQPQ